MSARAGLKPWPRPGLSASLLLSGTTRQGRPSTERSDFRLNGLNGPNRLTDKQEGAEPWKLIPTKIWLSYLLQRAKHILPGLPKGPPSWAKTIPGHPRIPAIMRPDDCVASFLLKKDIWWIFIYDVSEVLQPGELKGFSCNFCFLHRSWNNGMLEY